MKSHTRPSDRDDSFSHYIDQRDPQAEHAEVEYAAKYQEEVAEDNPEEFAEREQGCQFVRMALKSLTAREQDFVKKSFGIGCPCMSKEEIGKSSGITSSRVGAIITKALRKLRYPSRSNQLRDLLYGIDEYHRRVVEVNKPKVTKPHAIFGSNPEQYLVARPPSIQHD